MKSNKNSLNKSRSLCAMARDKDPLDSSDEIFVLSKAQLASAVGGENGDREKVNRAVIDNLARIYIGFEIFGW